MTSAARTRGNLILVSYLLHLYNSNGCCKGVIDMGSEQCPIRVLRLSMRLSQEKLGSISSISQSEISRLEAGKVQPRWFTVEALARVFKMKPVALSSKLVVWFANRNSDNQDAAATKKTSQVEQLSLPLPYTEQPHYAP